jgi:hypothetical protein
VPPAIVAHIAATVGGTVSRDDLIRYAVAGTSGRHRAAIRTHLHLQPYGTAARHILVRAMADAAQTKDAIADRINVAIEELVHQRFELPGFPTLARAAGRVGRARIVRSTRRCWPPSTKVLNYTLFVRPVMARQLRTPAAAVA